MPFADPTGQSDEELRDQLSEYFGFTDDAALARLRAAQTRYGGLRYYSRSFGHHVVFEPCPEYDAEDGEPIAWFIDHAVASPLAVWMLADGVIAYCFPGSHVGKAVPVFRSGDALIEADALHQECTTWTRVDGPQGLGATTVRAAAERMRLPLLEAASGFTEAWWERDGFRLHASLTFAEVFESPEEAGWRIWADGASGKDAALSFLTQAAAQLR
ncbi:hypothetical protein [Streptomyces sp. CA-132043]|uniref:hypothetical protein n=1 Tax=Streptomyces sp. CA-132043 TaxID=3240048 RepID=UPI003D8A23BB